MSGNSDQRPCSLPNGESSESSRLLLHCPPPPMTSTSAAIMPRASGPGHWHTAQVTHTRHVSAESNFEPSGCFQESRTWTRLGSRLGLQVEDASHHARFRVERRKPRALALPPNTRGESVTTVTQAKRRKNFPCPGIPCHRNKKHLSGDWTQAREDEAWRPGLSARFGGAAPPPLSLRRGSLEGGGTMEVPVGTPGGGGVGWARMGGAQLLSPAIGPQ